MGPVNIRGQATRVRVFVSDRLGRPASPGLARWLAGAAPVRARGAVHVALVSDARVRALNLRYRGEDHATDVLSFPAIGPVSPPHARRRQPHAHVRSSGAAGAMPNVVLGDIVIAVGRARKQARTAGHSETTELRVLALHGLLHLLGYDHERDNGEMARLERRLGQRSGLREGLIGRR